MRALCRGGVAQGSSSTRLVLWSPRIKRLVPLWQRKITSQRCSARSSGEITQAPDFVSRGDHIPADNQRLVVVCEGGEDAPALTQDVLVAEMPVGSEERGHWS